MESPQNTPQDPYKTEIDPGYQRLQEQQAQARERQKEKRAQQERRNSRRGANDDSENSQWQGKSQGKSGSYRGIKLWRTPDEDGNFAPLDEKQTLRLKEKAFNYCVWTLTQSSKTEHDLRSKMARKNCPEDIIDSTIAQLCEFGYINDTSFAEYFIEDKRLAGWGDNKIKMELRRRGVAEDVIEALFTDPEEEAEESEYERAKELVKFKFQSVFDNPSVDRRKGTQRLMGTLVRKGYGFGVASQVINDLYDAEEEEQ